MTENNTASREELLSSVKPSVAIARLAVPATIALLAKAVYNIVDTAYMQDMMCRHGNRELGVFALLTGATKDILSWTGTRSASAIRVIVHFILVFVCGNKFTFVILIGGQYNFA